MTAGRFYRGIQRAAGGAIVCALLCALIPTTAKAQSSNDPLQGLNRKTHALNERLDRFLLRPVARGWAAITPELVRQSLSNFDNNIRFPVVLANNILQWKWRAAAEETARFAVNTTVGILGFRDPATGMGLELQLEDMGQTFAVWGIPAGPYLVLPLFGPSNPRDAVGLVGDSFLTVYWIWAPFYVSLGYNSMNVINRRALADRDLENARNASLDFYVFVRDAYSQRRSALVRDMADVDAGEGLYEVDDDLYELEDEEEQEEND